MEILYIDFVFVPFSEKVMTDNNSDDHSRNQRPRLIRQLLNLQFQNPGPEIADFNPEERRRTRQTGPSKKNQHESDGDDSSQERNGGKTRDTFVGASSRGGAGRGKNGQSSVLYSEKGIHRDSGVDLCDCLDVECPGCWRACSKCKSTKCGVHCRNNRKFVYTKIYSQTSDCCTNQPFHLRRFPNLNSST